MQIFFPIKNLYGSQNVLKHNNFHLTTSNKPIIFNLTLWLPEMTNM